MTTKPTPTFLEDPAVVLRDLQPRDFDFLAPDASFAARVNALLRALLLLTAIVFLYTNSPAVLRGAAFAALVLVVFVYNRTLSDARRRHRREQQQEEGFRSGAVSEAMDDELAAVARFRQPTVRNPTGNFLPTDLIEIPNALPAPPADNAQASAERLELFEQAIRAMNPQHNEALMDAVNASAPERLRFERQTQRDFMTNPVTAATPDMEAYFAFLSGSDDFRTRVMHKDAGVAPPHPA